LLLDPAPDLPDDTEINQIQLPTRIRTVLNKAGFKTIGEIRQSSDANLLQLQRSGPVLIAFLRKALGPPS
jgi:DNA-directed RNA polymerase alpha subunit